MPNSYPILVGAPALARSTAMLMKTGQTTSYRTGDDGDLERGRLTNFSTLAENNPFGNTNRFTDILGGTTYTNNIVIDWSTYDGSKVLGYSRVISLVKNWDDAIDNALLYSVGSFSSGWYLPNRREMQNICNSELSIVLNYEPFNFNANYRLWTSTNRSTTAITLRTDTDEFTQNGKTAATTYRHIAVRNFTVTGTTLT